MWQRNHKLFKKYHGGCMGGINLRYTFYNPGMLYSPKISTFRTCRALRILSASNQALLPVHTLSIHHRNSIQGLGRRMKPIFRMGLFLSFFLGRVYHPVFLYLPPMKAQNDWNSTVCWSEFFPRRLILFYYYWREQEFIKPQKVEELELCCQGRHIPKLLQSLLRSSFTDFPV